MAVSFSIIGRHIRTARKACGCTQEEIAEQFKMTVAHYGRLERGERAINLERLSQISILLKVPIEKLVEGCNPDFEGSITEDPLEISFLQKMQGYMHSAQKTRSAVCCVYATRFLRRIKIDRILTIAPLSKEWSFFIP